MNLTSNRGTLVSRLSFSVFSNRGSPLNGPMPNGVAENSFRANVEHEAPLLCAVAAALVGEASLGEELAVSALADVHLSGAPRDIEEFGVASLQALIRRIRKRYTVRGQLARIFEIVHSALGTSRQVQPESHIAVRLLHLPLSLRIVLVLREVCELPPVSIGAIINMSTADVVEMLVEARLRLLKNWSHG